MEDTCKIFMNRGWLFSSEFSMAMTEKNYEGEMEEVCLPHTVAVTPFNSFSPKVYEKVSAYRKTFASQENWAGKKIILTVGAAAHKSDVFLNGKLLASHCCGYTSFSVDITDALSPAGGENVLCIRVDSRECLDQPPFGFVIDYMTYGGIYRDVYLEVRNPVFIEDVFVTTKKNEFTSRVTLNKESGSSYLIQQELFEWSDECGEEKILASVTCGLRGKTTLTSASAAGVRQWNLESPALYCLRTSLLDSEGNEVDSKTVRFGFREIRFDASGFYLNGIKLKIRGLNRHQSWPYVGYAMPKNMQREDADILKYELALNEVRTSHYPQSRHFVERCDEIGLLVFTEIPGWQHIGKSPEWREQALGNVRDMVLQYRNNPSVFMWGVRINESQDDDELYEKTNALCKSLDPSRPRGGVRCIKKSHLLEDVYTYNDFSFAGEGLGVERKKKITDTKKGFMVTEYNGHMYPVKSFDTERLRTEQARRHAVVLDAVAASDEHSGSSGWCAFDYNTHKDFGSGDYICYHGVMDMFRNPKTAAYLYKSQGDADLVGNVLEISSSMDIGDYPAGNIGSVWAFTNADSVRVSVNGTFVKEYLAKKDSPFKHLLHPPILIDDLYGSYIKNWGSSFVDCKFEAVRDGQVVSSCTKASSSDVFVKAVARRTLLVEDESYDIASVNFFACDQAGNVRPYCQEAILLRTEGPVELIGPCALSLKGGMAGTYVRTCLSDKGLVPCEAKNAALVITDWLGREARVEFKIARKCVSEL